MAKPMTKLERVLRTMKFQETDRVPLYDIFENDAIIEHYAGKKLTVDDGTNIKGRAIGRVLDMTRMVEGPKSPGVFHHENGVVVQQERWQSWVIETPFQDTPGLIDWVKTEITKTRNLKFDCTYVEKLHKFILQRQAVFAEYDPTGRNDPTVIILETGVGLTEMYSTMGLEKFSYLLVDYPELVEEWLEERNLAELRRVEAIANASVIPIVLTYDDIAYKNATLFSPKWLREYWVPRLKRLVDAWHAHDTYCIFHSDGRLWAILDDLIEAGIDGLNPLEVLAGMNVKDVREKYPNLVLTGGIDVSQLLTLGQPEEVRQVCQQAIIDSGGRGYFMGSSTELHWDVRLENAIAMFEVSLSNH